MRRARSGRCCLDIEVSAVIYCPPTNILRVCLLPLAFLLAQSSYPFLKRVGNAVVWQIINFLMIMSNKRSAVSLYLTLLVPCGSEASHLLQMANHQIGSDKLDIESICKRKGALSVCSSHALFHPERNLIFLLGSGLTVWIQVFDVKVRGMEQRGTMLSESMCWEVVLAQNCIVSSLTPRRSVTAWPK